MKTSANKIMELVKGKDKLLSGTYSGIWGGYVVEFSIGDNHFTCQTKDGVRGINVPCIVVIDEQGNIEVQTK